MARVAIGIPVFNEEVYIRETLRSVLRQFESFSDIEICVSDNSSTDSSLDEVEKAIDDFSSTSSNRYTSGTVSISRNSTFSN